MMTPLNPELVLRFRTLVEQHLGLRFDDTKTSDLENALRSRSGAKHLEPEAYLTLLSTGEGEEVAALAPHLTVNETYFFRNNDQFLAFRNVALPSALNGPGKHLRLLSAGCASGEEAYSLAMTIEEAYPALDASIQIEAFDLNRAVLERARAGRYSRWALRETSPQAVRRWFSPDGGGFVLAPRVRERVEFSQLNLAQAGPQHLPDSAYDVVFCRNVLMYFSPEACRRAVATLARALVPGGYLFLGHAETLRGVSDAFELCNTHGVFYYRRKGSGAESRAVVSVPARSFPSSVLTSEGSWMDAVRESAERVSQLSAQQTPTAAPRTAPESSELRGALELLGRERFDQALSLLRQLPELAARSPEALILEAVLLVQAGEIGQAQTACGRLLQLDATNAGAHYVLAVCLEAEGKFERAEQHDRSAITLDPDFAMPHLHLGLMQRRLGKTGAARYELALAHDLLKREKAERLLLYGAGFGRQALLALCRPQPAVERGDL